MPTRRLSEAAARNREPIRQVLARHLERKSRVLEIASGTGEHGVYLAPALDVHWQPSDPDAASRDSIEAWRLHEGDVRIAPPLDLDVERDPWPPLTVDALLCVNMLHIAPWTACPALMRRARDVLAPGGRLFLYGPYRREGIPTASSNEAFDLSLRARNPAWGLRHLDEVTAEAATQGLVLDDVVQMPANNLMVVFTRAS